MVFILSSPRSGSTLLRVMLAGHSRLFSPPELNLLPFPTMAERERILGGDAHRVIPCDQRVGLIEAVMHVTGRDAWEAESWASRLSAEHASTEDAYRFLRESAAPRRVVDKSTLNASCVAFLERTRSISPRAHYIHLVRHPYSVIESLERVYFGDACPQEAFAAAEELWTVPNRNIFRFLETVEPGRQLTLRFEDLARDPEDSMRAVCDFLDLDFEPGLLEPYGSGRMTEGSPGRFASLGDPNFLSHGGIESRLADSWQTISLRGRLSAETVNLAARLQYELPSPEGEDRGRKLGQVILVVPPHTYRADEYIRAARKLGLEPVCALDPSYGLPEEEACYLPVSFQNPECAAGALADYAWGQPVRAVVSVDDGGALVASLTCRALGLPHNPVEAIETTHNKFAMRVLMARACVPGPNFSLHRVCENPARLAEQVRYPVVLKPLYLSGSRGVIRADDSNQFVSAFGRIARLLQQPDTGPEPKSLLIEDYIPGAEVSLDGVLEEGRLRVLAIYDKPDPLEGPYFEETMCVTPSRFAEDVQGRIVECAQRAAQAVGLKVGPVHVEMRVDGGEPRMLELAARTMGGYCTRALPFEGSRTVEELVLSQAAGLETGGFVPSPGAHGVMMIPIPGEGLYRGVEGVEEAEAVEGVTGVMMTTTPGAEITPLPEGDKYVGFIFASGGTPEYVEDALRKAHRLLKFDLDPVTRLWLRVRAADDLGCRTCR
jgi:biotin carboxylase